MIVVYHQAKTQVGFDVDKIRTEVSYTRTNDFTTWIIWNDKTNRKLKIHLNYTQCFFGHSKTLHENGILFLYKSLKNNGIFNWGGFASF